MTTTIEQRIEALERQNRRLKLVGGATIGMVLLAAVFGLATSKKAETSAWKGRIIEAEAFVVRDKDGLRRAALKVHDDYAGLAVFGTNGKVRAILSTSKDGPALDFKVADGENRVALTLSKDGPTLRLHDEKGETRAILGVSSQETIRTGTVTKRPESSLVLYDKEGKVIWKAP